jgi:Zinc carboxypeptidase
MSRPSIGESVEHARSSQSASQPASQPVLSPMTLSIQKLGTAPSTKDVDQWMQDLGLRRTVLEEKSVQGRDLIFYELTPTTNNNNNNHKVAVDESDRHAPTILFLSLEHGNEPIGLLSLLSTVQILLRYQKTAATALRASKKVNARSIRILFFPIVNVDAYTLNLETAGTGEAGDGVGVVGPIYAKLATMA